METILEKINNDLKAAMKAKDELVLSTLRMLIAAVKNKKIELLGGRGENLTDEQTIAVAGAEIKKRKDAILNFIQGGRQDLAEKEEQEIKILEKYLPKQAADEEIEKVVSGIISAAGGEKNFGQIMGLAMRELKGKADGNRVAEIVKKLLG